MPCPRPESSSPGEARRSPARRSRWADSEARVSPAARCSSYSRSSAGRWIRCLLFVLEHPATITLAAATIAATADPPSRAYASRSLSLEPCCVAEPERLAYGAASPRGMVRRIAYDGGVNDEVRTSPAARPLAATTSAILRDASSIISSPSMAEPLAPPARRSSTDDAYASRMSSAWS